MIKPRFILDVDVAVLDESTMLTLLQIAVPDMSEDQAGQLLRRAHRDGRYNGYKNYRMSVNEAFDQQQIAVRKVSEAVVLNECWDESWGEFVSMPVPRA